MGLQEGKNYIDLYFFLYQYTGDWFQVQGIPSFFQPADTQCVRATYKLRDEKSISVRNIGYFGDSQDDFQEICGYAESKDPSNPAQLKLHFPGTPEGDYWVLDTDYDNWSAVYSCGDIFGLVKFEYAFLLTRENHPSEEVVSIYQQALLSSCFLPQLINVCFQIASARKAYSDQGVSLDSFINVPQPEDCIYESPDGSSNC